MTIIALLALIQAAYSVLLGWHIVKESGHSRRLSYDDRYALRHPIEMYLWGPIEEEVKYRAGPICIGFFLFGINSGSMWIVVILQAIWFALCHYRNHLVQIIFWQVPMGLIWGSVFLLATRAMSSPLSALLLGLLLSSALHCSNNLVPYLCAVRIAKRLRLGRVRR